MDVMSIGEFAQLSRLSQKALRLYDELGLLPPARDDPGSGYRFYKPDQLGQARLVAALRPIGVPAAEIKVIIALEPETAAAQVASYWARVEDEHAARSDLATVIIDRLNGKRSVRYQVAPGRSPREVCCV